MANVQIFLSTVSSEFRSYREAKPLMRRALEIFIVSLGPEHPNSRTVAANYVGLQQAMGWTEKAIEGDLALLLQRG